MHNKSVNLPTMYKLVPKLNYSNSLYNHKGGFPGAPRDQQFYIEETNFNFPSLQCSNVQNYLY